MSETDKTPPDKSEHEGRHAEKWIAEGESYLQELNFLTAMLTKRSQVGLTGA